MIKGEWAIADPRVTTGSQSTRKF